MEADRIAQIDAEARAGFTYKPDAPGTNPWRSYAAQAAAGEPWAGECADLTSTWLQLMCEAGAPLSGLYRLVVDSTGCGKADHMVGAARADDGRFWIGGDTFRDAYPAEGMSHIPVQWQRMDDISAWQIGAPWSAGIPGA